MEQLKQTNKANEYWHSQRKIRCIRKAWDWVSNSSIRMKMSSNLKRLILDISQDAHQEQRKSFGQRMADYLNVLQQRYNKTQYVIDINLSYNKQVESMAKIQAGSPGLFKIIQILNILFGVSALALIALGIWLWRQFGAFSIIEIAFLSLGFFQFLLVLFVFTSKRSVIKLRIYLFFMMILFVLQITAIVLVFALGDKIVDQVVAKLDEQSKEQIERLKQEFHKYLYAVTYYCIGVLVVVLLEMSFTYCYIGSIRNKNFQFDYKFLDENGSKITLDQKTQYDREKVAQKYDQKRQQLYQKYPKYQQYKQGK